MEVKMKDTSSKNRLWIAIIAGAVGLFLVIVAPLLVQLSLERVLTELLEVITDRPQFTSGLALFNLFYPIWRALGFVAIGVLFFINLPAFKQALIGERLSGKEEETSIEEEAVVEQVAPAT
jgi:hypothetical protein